MSETQENLRQWESDLKAALLTDMEFDGNYMLSQPQNQKAVFLIMANI